MLEFYLMFACVFFFNCILPMQLKQRKKENCLLFIFHFSCLHHYHRQFYIYYFLHFFLIFLIFLYTFFFLFSNLFFSALFLFVFFFVLFLGKYCFSFEIVQNEEKGEIKYRISTTLHHWLWLLCSYFLVPSSLRISHIFYSLLSLHTNTHTIYSPLFFITISW